MAELTGLHQTTEAVSLSLQALLDLVPNSLVLHSLMYMMEILSGEAFTSDALKIAWVLSYMKAGQASTYALCIFGHSGGVESFSSWTEFEKEFQAEFFSLDPAKTAALSLPDQTQYGQGKQSLNEYIDSFHALVE
ncbi:hypothetical protein C0989_000555 [Termitomyces sp. Mn162]|nr:hypothetical protein C0989_000555 [Termitomyces sp. Mn162]